jgi:hypothetical protein
MRCWRSEPNMSANEILAAIKTELGNPSAGAIVDNWALIEAAVYRATGEKPGTKETRVIRAAETPED